MQYFAVKSTQEIAQEIRRKVDDYFRYLQSSGHLELLRKSYKTYYSDAWIRSVGDRNHLQKISVNHYRSLCNSLLSIVSESRIAFQARAVNSDLQSQAQCTLANQLLDYYLREKGLEALIKKATEQSLFLSEAWISLSWDINGGEIYSVDENSNPIFDGDLSFKIHGPTDLIRDVDNTEDKHEWYILREKVNKYILASDYPDFSSEILKNTLEFDNEIYELNRDRFHKNQSESDYCYLYRFYHNPTKLLPNGRYVEMCGDSVLIDTNLPYNKIPLFKISPAKKEGTCLSDSPMFSCLPLQDALDTSFSTALSNMAAFGVQNLAIPKGSGISVNQISSGLNLIEFDSKVGAPQPLQLLATPPEVYGFQDKLLTQMEILSGISNITRGQAPASFSGSAMALLASQSLQNASNLQQSYALLLENVGSLIIDILKQFAATPRLAQIAGKNSKYLLKQFKGEDLSGVSRVIVDLGNPLSKTTSGRIELAKDLLNSGFIKSPEQYLSVVENGTLEPLLESERSEILYLREENESLASGIVPRVIITDDHALHIKEHLALLNNVEIRNDEALVTNVLNHVQEHINLSKQLPPELLQVLGRQPIGVMQPQVPNQNVLNNQAPIDRDANNVAMPNMPMNPMTGERNE